MFTCVNLYMTIEIQEELKMHQKISKKKDLEIEDLRARLERKEQDISKSWYLSSSNIVLRVLLLQMPCSNIVTLIMI